MCSCLKRSIWAGILVLIQSYHTGPPPPPPPDLPWQHFAGVPPFPLAFNNLVSDLDAGAESWLMKLVAVLDLEEPWRAQEMNSKWSWQAGERVQDEEVEISQGEVLRIVLMKKNSNSRGLAHLEDVLKRLSMSYDVLAQKNRSYFGSVVCKI